MELQTVGQSENFLIAKKTMTLIYGRSNIIVLRGQDLEDYEMAYEMGVKEEIQKIQSRAIEIELPTDTYVSVLVLEGSNENMGVLIHCTPQTIKGERNIQYTFNDSVKVTTVHNNRARKVFDYDDTLFVGVDKQQFYLPTSGKIEHVQVGNEHVLLFTFKRTKKVNPNTLLKEFKRMFNIV